jgi:hypothetical protein
MINWRADLKVGSYEGGAWERAVSYLLFLAAIGAQFMLLAAAIVTLHQ